MGLGGLVVKLALRRELARETDVVVWVILADQRSGNDGIEGVDHVVPDGGTTVLLLALVIDVGLGFGLRRRDNPGVMISLEHSELVHRNTESGPEERFLADNEIREQARHDVGSDFLLVDFPLLSKGLGLEQILDLRLETENSREDTDDTDRIFGATGVVETLGTLAGEDVVVPEPVLVGTAGKVRGETRDEQGAEVGVLSFTKDLPEISIRERRERGHLEFQKMVLRGVEINSVDAGRTSQGIRKNVVSGAGDGQDHVVRSQLQQTRIHTRILPGESVDVLVLELGVLLEGVIVVDTPVVVLVEERGQREIGRQVHNGRIECLGAKLAVRVLDVAGEGLRVVDR